mgnify:CR=1 FL=1
MTERPQGEPTATPPGWYPTPSGETRFWDGSQWTAHAQPHTAPGYAVAPYGAPPGSYAAQPAATVHAAPYGQVVVAPKSPGLALIASFFIPGLGQFINGDGAKGAIFLAAYVISWILCFVLIGIPLVFATWVWSMIDAYTSATAWNAARGIIS